MPTRQRKKGTTLTLLAFCERYDIPDTFNVDRIPVKHPETGGKIYLIGAMMAEVWYRKKPGQAGKEGRMWPLAQGPGFNPGNLEVHPDIRKELDSVGSFTKRSSLRSR